MQPVQHLDVDADDAGQRLDAYLARRFAELPKSHLYRWIRSGQLRVNGARCAIDYRLQSGDRIRVPPIFGKPADDAVRSPVGEHARRAADDPVHRERAQLARRLPVLYEDDDLIAIDKPAGVAVHGGSGVSSGVIERLRAARPEERFLELAHRIDRETSGVLVIARRRSALLALQAQWRERAPAKRYLAIVSGSWPLRSKTLDAPLRRMPAPGGDRRVAVHAEGQEEIGRAHV